MPSRSWTNGYRGGSDRTTSISGRGSTRSSAISMICFCLRVRGAEAPSPEDGKAHAGRSPDTISLKGGQGTSRTMGHELEMARRTGLALHLGRSGQGTGKVFEPPCTERHARRCERTVGESIANHSLDRSGSVTSFPSNPRRGTGSPAGRRCIPR